MTEQLQQKKMQRHVRPIHVLVLLVAALTAIVVGDGLHGYFTIPNQLIAKGFRTPGSEISKSVVFPELIIAKRVGGRPVSARYCGVVQLNGKRSSAAALSDESCIYLVYPQSYLVGFCTSYHYYRLTDRGAVSLIKKAVSNSNEIKAQQKP